MYFKFMRLLQEFHLFVLSTISTHFCTMKTILATAFISLTAFTVQAQISALGQWEDLLPYRKAIKVMPLNNKVYAATNYSLMYFDKDDNSINRLSKVSGLSDIGVSCAEMSAKHELIIVGYANGNIDIIEKNTITNLSDVKRKNIPADKQIYDIIISGDFAYLACGFGILKFDLIRKEINSTFIIGENGSYSLVKQCFEYNNRLYALGINNLKYVNLNSTNLADFQNWSNFQNLPNDSNELHRFFIVKNTLHLHTKGVSFKTDNVYKLINNQWEIIPTLSSETINSIEINESKNTLHVCGYDEITEYDFELKEISRQFTYGNNKNPAPMHVRYDSDNVLWLADAQHGIGKKIDLFTIEFYTPKSPKSINANSFFFNKNEILIAPGAKTPTVGSVYFPAEIYNFDFNTWTEIDNINNPELANFHDILNVFRLPNSNTLYATALGYGLLEFENNTYKTVYNSSNSSLQKVELPGDSTYAWVGASDLDIDINNNVWVANSLTNKFLSVKKANGDWKVFDFSSIISTGVSVSSIRITNDGNKWIVLPLEGIMVFSENETIDNETDDKKRLLRFTEGQGSLPGETVNTLVQDKKGDVWVGTNNGIAVFYNSSNVFTEGAFEAQRIFIQQDGYTQYLLENEDVSCIAIDGANRKWIGTKSGGVFLMSADGTRQLLQFNMDNSPLFSNNIIAIGIHPKTGDVLISTENGMLSYRADVSESAATLDNIKVFPNPVKENYSGDIGISGLVDGASIKITDLAGNLVYETRANGGTATWNGKNLSGNNVSQGVYMVFVSTKEGNNTAVSKLMMLRK
jgi:hypothetical protein